jgi:Zn-dependent protease with chaperone function
VILGLAALFAAGIAAPHVAHLDRVRPLIAAAAWAASLVLSALLSLLAAVAIVRYLPHLRTFVEVSAGCWHAVIPGVASHLVVSGHTLGDVALLAPASLLTLSLAWGALGFVRAARAVRRCLGGASVGVGPRRVRIYPDRAIVLATTGLLRPRVVVSAGALVELDDDELTAGLDHEEGHIARKHRWVLLLGGLCRDLGRGVPGSSRAEQELRHHLERDADAFALRASSRETLARAICKAATSPDRGVSAGLGGGSTVRRVKLLLEPSVPSGGSARAASALALVLLLTALGGAATVATAADRAAAHLGGVPGAALCDHARATDGAG